MREPIRILLQTTIPDIADDWHIGRFSLLGDFLRSQIDESGTPLFAVTARNRVGVERDPVLSTLDSSDFDELWLFAVDVGEGLPVADCKGIGSFHQRGGYRRRCIRRVLRTGSRSTPSRSRAVTAKSGAPILLNCE